MYNKQTLYKTPENFCVQNAKYFLANIEGIFQMKDLKKSGVFFNVIQTKKIDLLGLLLIYKFLNYTVKKKCFFNPKTDLRSNKYISEEMIHVGFEKLVNENFSIKNPDETKTTFKQVDGFFIAPIVLENTAEKNIDNSIVKKITKYYNDTQITAGLLQCIGEISSNFQEHAVLDTKSVLVARGNKERIEIACADNGKGIITSLMPHLDEDYKSCRYNVLLKSIEENITSKASDGHMGCGLWLVNQLVTRTKGEMIIFSEDGYLINRKGKLKCGQSPFWEGTVIYLKMPLLDKSVFSHILKEKENLIDSKSYKIELNIA